MAAKQKSKSIHRYVFMPRLPCKKLSERARQRRGEGQFFSGRRVDKAEELGVQAESIDGIARGAVHSVADDRTSRLGEVRADLVLAPRLQRHFEHGELLVRFDGAV